VLCITDTGRRHLAERNGKALRSRRNPAGIRLLTHGAHEWTERYPAVIAAMYHLPVKSCLIDGEGRNDDRPVGLGEVACSRLRRGAFLEPI
jgi:hypothetical protein